MCKKIIEESDWWLRALFGERPSIHGDSAPEPGFYKRRIVARGKFIPVRIWVEESRDDDGELLEDVRYYCEVDGKQADVWEEWLMVCKYPISRDEWEMMENERVRQGACGFAG